MEDNQLIRLEENVKKDLNSLTNEELFYELEKVDKTYSEVLHRARFLMSGISEGKYMPTSEELRNQSENLYVLINRLSAYSHEVKRELGERLGLDANKMGDITNRVITENFS